MSGKQKMNCMALRGAGHVPNNVGAGGGPVLKRGKAGGGEKIEEAHCDGVFVWCEVTKV